MRRDVELGHHVAVEREVEPGRHGLGGLRGVGGDLVFEAV